MIYNIGNVVKLLDHGYIKLVDVMGSDEEICKAARVSYHEASTKKAQTDRALIDYLMRHRHTSPFEMGVMKFEIKLPIFVERQWVRHRTCSMNEMSGRYSEMPEEYYDPELTVIRAQSKTNKQGRDEPIDEIDAKEFKRSAFSRSRDAFTSYRNALDVDVARELSRIQLPLGTYTKKVWMMNLHNLLHFLGLRTHSHAQWEIRQYANEMEKFVQQHFPWTYSSWKNHVQGARRFSMDEYDILKNAISYQKLKELINLSEMTKRRKAELRAKLGIE